MKRILYVIVTFCIFVTYAQSQEPKLILPIGHTNGVNYAQFSNDGKRILTVSDDKTAKIWESETGKILANLKGHKSSIIKGYFSPNGNTILTIGDDSSAILWNTSSASIVKILGTKKSYVTDAQFSKDGKLIFATCTDSTVKLFDAELGLLKYQIKNTKDDVFSAALNSTNTEIATIGSDFNIRIWKVSTGKQIKVLKGHTDFINFIEYSPDGTKLISGSNDSTARIWSSLGSLLFTMKANEYVNFARFSPDKKTISSVTSKTITISESDSGKFLQKLELINGEISSIEYSTTGEMIIANNDQGAQIWEAATGRTIRIIDLKDNCNYACFNNDGTKLIAALKNNIASVWDLDTEEEIIDLTGHTYLSLDINFSADGKRLVSANDDYIGRIWDNNSKITNLLVGHLAALNTAEFSNDGKWVITSSNDSTIKLWDANKSKPTPFSTLRGHSSEVLSAKLSNDKLKIITTGNDNCAILYKSNPSDSTFSLIKNIKNQYGPVGKAFFSPNGQRFVIYSSLLGGRTFVYLGDANTGNLIDSCKGIGNMYLSDISFSSDSKYLITCSIESGANVGPGLQIWNTNDGSLHKNIFIKKGFNPHTAIFSPDGTKILCGSQNNEFKILDLLHSEKEPITLTKVPSVPIDIKYSPDGTKILMSLSDLTARIWDVKTGKETSKLVGHTDDLISAQFSPDGKYILTNSFDNTFKRWTNDGKFLYTFFPLDRGYDYLAIDSSGRYDGTSEGKKLLYFACGTEIIELEQIEDLCWQPDLVRLILANKTGSFIAKKISEIQLCNNTPTVVKKGFNNKKYEFLILPNKGLIGTVQLFINAQLRKEYPLDSLNKQKDGGYLLSIPIESIRPFFISGSKDANTIMVKATTLNGEMTSRGGEVIGPEIINNNNEKPNIYIVSIGVSNYKSEKLKLDYPAIDAESFGSAIDASAIKYIDKDHVHTSIFITDSSSLNLPTKVQIQKRLMEIAKTAKADDVFIMFFAGHGILLEGDKNLYLLTAEASTFEIKGSQKVVAISTTELNKWMQDIKANKKLIILDACNSGVALEGLKAKGAISTDQTKALENLKDNSGFFILSASASGQSAYESQIFGHGILTYSLLRGIKMGEGLKKNNEIGIIEWFNNASESAKEWAKSVGKTQDPQILFAHESFSVGLADNEVKDGIHINKEPKKIFSKTILFSDVKLYIDDLQIGAEFDNELASTSVNEKSLYTFIGTHQGSDDYSIRGSYEMKDTTLTIKANLVTQNKSVGKEIIRTGTIEQKDQLIKSIIDDFILLIK
jgi:WD40 repeat protein